MASASDSAWLNEAVIRFLQGPLYSTPLMSFIDNKCHIFDTEEECKLEYTNVHEEFKNCVDEVISDFLNDLGVSAEQFAEVVESSDSELDAFVVSSILTVDDFVQFRAMMIKRNIDLTNEVLREIEAAASAAPAELASPVTTTSPKGKEAAPEPATPKKDAEGQAVEIVKEAPRTPKEAAEEMDEERMMEMALKLSQRQFEAEKELREAQEKAVANMNDGVGDDASVEDKALAAAIRESMQEQLEQERAKAEMQQALALSAAIEEERQKMKEESDGASGSGCAPAPLKAPAGGLKPIADVKAEGAAKAAAIKEQLLNRAAEIDRQAEERLAAVAAGVAPVEASVARLTVSDDEVARRKAYLLKQREALLAKRAAQRKVEVEEYKQNTTAAVPPSPVDKFSNTQVGPTASLAGVDAAADAARAALRRSLAQSLKQDLVKKAKAQGA